MTAQVSSILMNAPIPPQAQVMTPAHKNWWVQTARALLANSAMVRKDINVIDAHELVDSGAIPRPWKKPWFTAVMKAPYFKKVGHIIRDRADKPVSKSTQLYKLDINEFYRVQAQNSPPPTQSTKSWFSTSSW